MAKSRTASITRRLFATAPEHQTIGFGAVPPHTIIIDHSPGHGNEETMQVANQRVPVPVQA